MDKDIIEKIYKKRLGECLAYQAKFDEKPVQVEFQAPKQEINMLTKKQKVAKTKPAVLDTFGFESTDRPHIEKWIKRDKNGS